ncbi:LAMI_0H05160g1_1 [Lachancea mirantina]|uniref:LAMI_0H05160g1_1 n=1 Tax=Lachancea mirantina TaxID=1230905 RepID=A0A1G4KF10_9SACH|nr:LAMI_0H05160g1_1 [Lachancea mirantina]
MSADCSVGVNPLGSLNKHAQADRSLQQGASFRYSNEAAGPAFKSHDGAVSELNRARMDAFKQGECPGEHQARAVPASTFIPMVHQQNSENAWSRQFTSSPELAHGNLKGRGGWAAEMKAESPQVQGQAPNLSSDYRGPNGIVSPEQRFQGFQPRMMSHYRHNLSAALPMGALGAQAPTQYQHQRHGNMEMTEQHWDEQFLQLEREVSQNLNIESDHIRENVAGEREGVATNPEEVTVDDNYQAEFQEVWDSLREDVTDMEVQSVTEWERDYQRYASGRSARAEDYKFESENQFLHNPNAYEIGCILMENGAKLSEAALAFEAAVQEDPEHLEAWLKLGLVQTQNEKETNGISALEQCLKLDPTNLRGMMTLAISHINEGYDVSAFSMLSKWLHTKYPDLVPSESAAENTDRYQLNKAVRTEFLQVVNALPDVDADLQLGLGILFYANDDFDKTIDCFRAALSIRPDDELMWNRLGASLANSNRSEEAIQAYHRALQLKPTFVRARCNLAVSSMNMGCYKEAAEHLLTALSMHEVEGVPLQQVGFSTTIIETLKRAFIAMERRDLLEQVGPSMNLENFRKEFNF